MKGASQHSAGASLHTSSDLCSHFLHVPGSGVPTYLCALQSSQQSLRYELFTTGSVCLAD